MFSKKNIYFFLYLKKYSDSFKNKQTSDIHSIAYRKSLISNNPRSGVSNKTHVSLRNIKRPPTDLCKEITYENVTGNAFQARFLYTYRTHIQLIYIRTLSVRHSLYSLPSMLWSVISVNDTLVKRRLHLVWLKIITPLKLKWPNCELPLIKKNVGITF